jgi:hypothetical protein
MKFTTQLIAAVATLAAQVQAEGLCHALAMSGGGSNGAWEAGMLWGFAHSANPSDFYYDVMTGISAGAINTAGLAGFAPEEVIAAADFLSDTWNSLSNDQIWAYQPNIPPVKGEGIKWELGLNGFLNYAGALNDDPALATLDRILSAFPEGYKKSIVIEAADVNKGEWHQFTEHNTAWSDLHQAALSSGSIPGIFPPQKWLGTAFMDGGTIWNINIDGAVKACLAKGFKESEIVLDISICFWEQVDTEPTVSTNAFQNYLENLHIHRFYSDITATNEEMMAYPDVQYRYYMMNAFPANGFHMLNFDVDNTWPMQLNGREAAAQALAAGPGVGFEAVKLWNAGANNVREKFRNFAEFYRHHISRK